jgi:hypothetical protein
MSSDSDDAGDLPRSASMRASLKRDLMASPAKLSSPLVTQAARRQLRGNKGERKSAAQVASELRAKVLPTRTGRTLGVSEISYACICSAPTSESKLPLHARSLACGHWAHCRFLLAQEAAEERQGEEANGRPDTRAPGAALELASKGGEAASRGGERVVIVRRRAAAGSASALTPGGNVGIGVKFTQARDGSHVITSLLPGGPAESTGQVRIGSSIEAVDGQRLRGRPSEQVIDAILGPPGGLVELALLEPPAPPPASPPATPASPPASPPRPSLAAHGASSTDGVRVPPTAPPAPAPRTRPTCPPRARPARPPRAPPRPRARHRARHRARSPRAAGSRLASGSASRCRATHPPASPSWRWLRALPLPRTATCARATPS